MQIAGKTITPCLWFDTQAEEEANFYVSVFKDSRVGKIARFGKVGQDVHGKKPGTVMTVEFELGGQPFDTQDEIDYFWKALSQGGQEGPCGWLKDKYGLSWQVVPSVLPKMMTDPDEKKSERVMSAFLKMKKFDLDAIKRAYEGRDA
jgi:predicted 3-demethylubiquinone-9 3-methyltransferase (glyoxalase superfamily)